MTTTNRVAIVTGAARGIGEAVATRMASDGFDVAVVDLDESAARATAEKIQATGVRAVGVGADVSKESDVAAAMEQITTELGEASVLVNNAGITRDNLLFKSTVEDWDSVMSVHLRGTYLMSKAAHGAMVQAKWGRIVNLSSVSALGNRGQVNYSAAKAGIQGLTKTLAIELGHFGVTANAVAPGFVETEMTALTAERVGVSFEEFKAAAAAKIPVGRVGQPEDIAAAVAFFVSREAGFVSGQVLYLAGGPRA